MLALEPRGDSMAEVRLRRSCSSNVFMAVEPGLALPQELAEIDSHALPVERDIDRYLLVMAAIYERTMQHGTTQRLVDNLRRAVAGIGMRTTRRISVWDARTAIEAATFLADDEVDEAEAVLDRVATSVAGLRSSAPVLQADLEHRRLMLAMAKGQFEDVLAAISLVEQRTAPGEMSRFTAGHRFIRGWIALQRGEYDEAGRAPGRADAARTASTRRSAPCSPESPSESWHMLAAQQLLHRRRRSGHRDRGRARAAPGREPRPRAARRS